MKNKLTDTCTDTVYFALEDIKENYGGPIRSISALMACLSENGFRVKVLQANCKLTADLNSFFKSHEIHSIWEFILKFMLNNNQKPIVVFNNQWTPSVQFLALLLFIFRAKYIWCVRGNLKRDNWKKKLVWNLSQKFLIRKASFILVSSQLAKKSIVNDVDLEELKIVVIPNIIRPKARDVGSFKFRSKSAVSKKKQNLIRILYLGRLHRKKKIHEIISNINSKRFSSRVVLTIAGYCDDYKYLQELKQSAVSEKVELEILINITEQQKIELFQNSDLFISMSDSENFGISIFEALWSGLCVIVDERIEFWPNSGMESVFAVRPSAISDTIEKILGRTNARDRMTRASVFRSAWASIEMDSEYKILQLFRQNLKTVE